MEHVGSIVAVIAAIILVAYSLCGLVIRRTSVRDLIWRTTLLLVALTPLLALSRSAVVGWQWSLPIWPVAEIADSHSKSIPNNKSAPEAGRPNVRRTRVPQSRSVPIPGEPSVNEPIEKVDSTGSRANSSEALPSAIPSKDGWSWTFFAAMVWVSGAMLQLWMIGRSVRKTIHLRRSAAIVDDNACLELVQRCARQVGLKHAPRLSTSSQVTTPIVIGLFRPQIVIPSNLLSDTVRHDLRAVLLHECGHLQRHDLFYELLLRFVLAAFWFHPLVYVLAVELRRVREEMCDNFVLTGESAINYAETLLRVASNQRRNEALLLGMGVISKAHRLERRVASILSPQRRIETHASRRSRLLVSVVALSVVVAGLLIRVSPIAATPPSKSTSQEKVNAPRRLNNSAAQEDGRKHAMEKFLAKLEGNPFEITFRVVDSQGQPVVGARVRPSGVSNSFGGLFARDEELWTSVESDEEGIVRFALPQEVVLQSLAVRAQSGALRATEVLVDPEQEPAKLLKTLDIQKLNLRIDHPDHPVWWDYLELRPNARVELQDSYTLIVHARRQGETDLARRVVPWLAGSRSTDWSEFNGVISYRRVDLTKPGSRPLLRVVQIPEDGRAWFSQVVDLTHLSGNPIELNLTLHPGVRVEGRLAESVPRPVKRGQVLGKIIHLMDDSHGSAWTVVAEIAEDGSFVLDSVPANETLQLAAWCEGWSSLPSTQEEVKAYQAKHQFPRERTGVASAGQILPQLVHIGTTDVRNLALPMQPTATCEITAVDPDRRPIPGVRVQFHPNQVFWHWGSATLGSSRDSTEFLRDQLITGDREETSTSIENDGRFSADTNENGKATITGLPCAAPDAPEGYHLTTFFAVSEHYVARSAVFDELPQVMNTPLLAVKLKPGRRTQLTVRMEPKSASSRGKESDVTDPVSSEPSPSDDFEVAGRVEDEQGNPIEGAKVLCGNEDCFDIQTDAQGRFRHRFDESWFEGEETPSLPLNFVKKGYAPLFREVQIGERNIRIHLKRNTWFEGIVRKPDGTPAANVPVTAYYEVYSQNPSSFFGITLRTGTTTDSAGRYRLFVQPAAYRVAAGNATAGVAWLPQNVEETPRERTKLRILPQEHRSLNIHLKPSVQLVAEFVDSLTGEPVPGANLFLGDNPAWDTWPEERYTSDTTGTLILPELPAGRYQVQIHAEKHLRCFSEAAVTTQENATPDFTPTDQGLTFELRPGMDPVRIHLEPAVEVSGVVLDPQGQPMANAEVSLGRDASDSSAQPMSRYRRRTDDQGRFRFLLPASDGRTYHLVAQDRYGSGKRQWGSGISRAFVAEAVHPIQDLEIRLSHPGMIRGRTVDQLGKPLAAVVVQATPVDRLEDANSNPSVTSARDGTFELRGLRPGRYWLHEKSTDSDGSFGLPQADVRSGETNIVGDVVIAIEEFAD